MSKRRVYQPRPAGDIRRRFEWVELPEGELCIWSMTAAEAAAIGEKSARPSIDPRGGVDIGAAGAWEIVHAAHKGEPTDPDNGPIFSDIGQVLCLPYEEFRALLEASNRVNGMSPTEAELRKVFTEATGARSSSDSTSSASSDWDDSPVKLTAP